MKITESINFVDLFCGIWKISLARYVGLVYKEEENESFVYFCRKQCRVGSKYCFISL